MGQQLIEKQPVACNFDNKTVDKVMYYDVLFKRESTSIFSA